MSDIDNINWFPGHMAKTRRMIEETVSKCDLVAEVVDARIPKSSSNGYLKQFIDNKPRIIILNKSDLADAAATDKWKNKLSSEGLYPIITDCKSKKGLNSFFPLVSELLKEKQERLKARNLTGITTRIMVVGIPNCGKSTFINAISGRSVAKAEDRPGVTRDVQLVHLKNGIDLFDMPGMLMPKIPDAESAIKLAVTGAVGENAFDVTELALKFCGLMQKTAPKALEERYKIAIKEENTPLEILSAIAKKRGFLIKGGELDFERTAIILLDEFRGGKLGRITLDEAE
ncbi:MAG: ribosome biogenesis GTPase YlqF [Clostridia bacterium]|nr:ribosome biogenesis GTPase YlqF [Clostridia bacterium]